jgi:hypothetical protein
MADITTDEEESPPTRDPSSLIFRIGDVLESHADEIEKVYRAYSSLTFMVGALAVIVTIFVAIVWTTLPWWSQLSYGVMDALIVGALVLALRAEKGLSLVGEVEWEVDRFRFITTFELLPPTGNTSSERLWNSLKAASHVSDDLKTLLAEKIKFNVDVPGKSGTLYKLEIFAHSEPSNLLERFLSKWTLWHLHPFYYHLLPGLHHRLHESQLTVLVKRIEKETPVTRKDLEAAKNAFLDISRKVRDLPEHAIVISRVGFSEDALDYARDDESNIAPFSDSDDYTVMDLVVEKSDGSFEVAHYG